MWSGESKKQGGERTRRKSVPRAIISANLWSDREIHHELQSLGHRVRLFGTRTSALTDILTLRQ